MTTYVVTRHQGAVDWLRKHHPELAEDAVVVQHLRPKDITHMGKGDVVVGVLPVYLMADICARGARTLIIAFRRFGPEFRGTEMSVEDMEACEAYLQEYEVRKK